jgi:hypothetical protein
MTPKNPAIAKLERIRQLWEELGRTKVNSPEHREIMQSVRTLSAEYQALVAASQKSEKPK